MLLAVGAAIALWLAPVFAAGVYVFRPSPPGAIAVGLVLAAGVARLSARPMADTIAPALRRQWVAVVVALAAMAAIAQIATISVYLADPARVGWSYFPSDPFRVRHSCMTAYVEALRFCGQPGTNIYQMDLYEPRQIGPLKVDSFHYPPPFLLLPAAVSAVAPDVFAFRAVWFAMQGAVLAGLIFGLARWIGGIPGAYAAAGGVLLFATPQYLFSLQQGNVQSTAVPLAALGFILLCAGRYAGAPLLAYVAAAKIFPGILIVFLAGARRWKALAATAAAGAAVVALTLLVVGPRPFEDFLRHELPRLSSGEAFPQTETIGYGVNFSVYGSTVRWRKLGFASLTRPRGLMIASAYGIGVMLLGVLAGWRHRPELDTAAGRLRLLQIGLSLLLLASLRSPFVPWYGFVVVLWLFTLLAAERSGTSGLLGGWAAIALLCAAHTSIPSPGTVPHLGHLVTAELLTFVPIAAAVFAVTRACRERVPVRAAVPSGASW